MSFKLTILGSGSALPTTKRFTSAHVLNVHERFFLIDCGEGTQVQLRRNKAKFSKLDHIFISHLHGDHFYGLFGLISTLGMLGRKSTLHIYAHPRLESIINSVLSSEEVNFKIEYHNLQFDESKLILETKHLEVTSFPLKHRTQTCGFLFKEKQKQANIRKDVVTEYNLTIPEILHVKNGSDLTLETGEVIANSILTTPPKVPRSYAYLSDTKYSIKYKILLQNVDLLYHEATFLAIESKLAKKTGHSTSVDAANFAKETNAKKLLLGHLSARYKDGEVHQEEARKIFPNSVFVNDNDTFIVKN